ncbi:MAG: hypothetical protein QXM43_05705, partial [Desulfurococcaceae archaeon]
MCTEMGMRGKGEEAEKKELHDSLEDPKINLVTNIGWRWNFNYDVEFVVVLEHTQYYHALEVGDGVELHTVFIDEHRVENVVIIAVVVVLYPVHYAQFSHIDQLIF